MNFFLKAVNKVILKISANIDSEKSDGQIPVARYMYIANNIKDTNNKWFEKIQKLLIQT